MKNKKQKIPKSQVNFDILPPPPTLTTYCILTVLQREIRRKKGIFPERQEECMYSQSTKYIGIQKKETL